MRKTFHWKSAALFALPVLISLLLHFRVLKLDVIGYHVWRQSQTQTVIYHFTFTDHSIFHPQKFDLTSGSTQLRYEFPLYQWIIAQANRFFNYSVSYSRVITFLIFILFTIGFYKILCLHLNKELALLSHWLICFSPLLYYYCVNPLPDTMALACSVWALYFFFWHIHTSRQWHFILFAALIGLAALVKLPYVLFAAVMLPHLWTLLKAKNYNKLLALATTVLLCCIPAMFWYATALQTWKGNDITLGIFANNKSLFELLDYFYFTLVSSVPELLCNYGSLLFLLCGTFVFIKRKEFSQSQKQPFLALFFALSAYYLFEINMIEKVHDYYLMPFVPLIFFVVAKGVKIIHSSRFKNSIYLILIIVPLTAWLRIDHRWDMKNPGFTTDYLTEQSTLQTVIPSESLCIIDYDESKFIALYYLKRYGFSLGKNRLDEVILRQLYGKGANILVTENRLDLSCFSDFEFETLFQKQLTVYKIKLK